MSKATARLEFRVSPEDRERIERAADILGEPVSAFARSAAEEKAEQVLREYEATTTAPAEFFDEVLRALDSPPVADPSLVHAMTRLREHVVLE